MFTELSSLFTHSKDVFPWHVKTEWSLRIFPVLSDKCKFSLLFSVLWFNQLTIIKAKNKNDPKKFNCIQDEFLLQNHSYFEKIEKSFDSSRNTGNNNNDSKLKIKIEISIKYSSRANKLNPRIQTPQNCKKI